MLQNPRCWSNNDFDFLIGLFFRANILLKTLTEGQYAQNLKNASDIYEQVQK